MRITDFVLERTYPEEHLNLSKSPSLAEKAKVVAASPKLLQLEL